MAPVDYLPPPPPAYDTSASFASTDPIQHRFQHLGFPAGYFAIQSVVQTSAGVKRAVDVRAHRTEEGTEICLFPFKQPTVERGSNTLHNTSNNQLFFLDWSGHLAPVCADGKVVDCFDGRLTLATPRPVYEYPSPSSHPFPQFSRDPETKMIHVLFTCDPTYPDPRDASTWMDVEYVLESVPIKVKPVAENWVAASTSGLLSGLGRTLFGGAKSTAATPPPTAVSHMSPLLSPQIEPPSPNTRSAMGLPPLPSSSLTPPSGTFNPTIALERSQVITTDSDSDSDSEPSPYRSLRIVRLPRLWRAKLPPSVFDVEPAFASGSLSSSPPLPPIPQSKEHRKWRRRQFDVIPVVVKPVVSPSEIMGSPVSSRPASSTFTSQSSRPISISSERSIPSWSQIQPQPQSPDSQSLLSTSNRSPAPKRLALLPFALSANSPELSAQAREREIRRRSHRSSMNSSIAASDDGEDAEEVNANQLVGVRPISSLGGSKGFGRSLRSPPKSRVSGEEPQSIIGTANGVRTQEAGRGEVKDEDAGERMTPRSGEFGNILNPFSYRKGENGSPQEETRQEDGKRNVSETIPSEEGRADEEGNKQEAGGEEEEEEQVFSQSEDGIDSESMGRRGTITPANQML